MTSYSNSLPSRVYLRRDLGIDPPSIATGLDLTNHVAEGGVVSFVDDEVDPVRDFDLHRIRGAFRISCGLAAPEGCFASPEAAIRAGWAKVDALLSDADVGIGPAGGAA